MSAKAQRARIANLRGGNISNGLFPAAEFEDDAEAIRHAANYEATLYKYKYKDGQRISSTILYEPA